jgi:DNA-binding XRE family transcriptional regulator
MKEFAKEIQGKRPDIVEVLGNTEKEYQMIKELYKYKIKKSYIKRKAGYDMLNGLWTSELEAKKELLKAEEFKDEYEMFIPRYEIVLQIIRSRVKQNITQEEMAYRTGVKKSIIIKLERGNYDPTVDFLCKVARSLGKELHIDLR